MSETCRICHRPLNNLKSIMRGMGPTCAGKQARAGQEGMNLGEAAAQLFDPIKEYLKPIKLTEDIKFWRDADGSPRCNIPIRFYYHSPTGIEWGYAGSGPADLALNILLCFVDSKKAFELHQLFKDEFIAPLPHDGGVIPVRVIEDWIAKQHRALNTGGRPDEITRYIGDSRKRPPHRNKSTTQKI